MNKKGTPKNLQTKHPGNMNALKSGVFSQRFQSLRAKEIREDLLDIYGTDVDHIALNELARLHALAEALDSDIEEQGVSTRRGDLRRQVGARRSVTSEIAKWHERFTRSTYPQSTVTGEPEIMGRREEYITLLREIARGQDPNARTQHRISAIAHLLQYDELDHPGEHSREWQLFKYMISMSPEDREREDRSLREPYLTIENDMLDLEPTELGEYPKIRGAPAPFDETDSD